MAWPAWWEDGAHPGRRRQNRRSREQESRVARAVGGRRQRGSGSSYRAPQDVKAPQHLVQVKYTDKDSFSLRRAEWERLCNDAARAGRSPMMVIEFMDGERTIVRIAVVEHGDG